MADQLVTPSELASFLKLTWADLSATQQAGMTMLAELATAKVQDAAGQRLVEATSTALIDVDICEYGPWLDLPQSPVRSVAAVEIDGVAVTDWYLRSQRLWRLNGWNTNANAPAQVSVTFTHGYLDGSWSLEPARVAALALGAGGWGNPGGATSQAIDDYRVTYAEADARMQVTGAMRDQLAAAYGSGVHVTGSR